MIKWEHSIFALPFALTARGASCGRLATAGRCCCWIIVCMVSARSSAMAFNRLVDARAGSRPIRRTALRALPAGALSRGFVVWFVVVASTIFVLGAAMLNRETLLLAPIALTVVLAYSYMKRVTRWSHAVLG